MARTFMLPIAQLTSLTAVPFAQLATPSTTGIVIVAIELGQETSETSQQEAITGAIRSTASTLPTSTTPLKVDRRNGIASLLTGSTTTNATGIASATGTLVDTFRFLPFNVMNGFVWLPTPQQQIHLPVSAFFTLQFATAPAANTWSGGIWFEEE